MKTSLLRILFITATLLLIPAIGSWISGEVHWSRSDYVIGGVLLMTFLAGLEIVFHWVKGTLRWILCLGVVLACVLVWAELAVGVFGTPFAGS